MSSNAYIVNQAIKNQQNVVKKCLTLSIERPEMRHRLKFARMALIALELVRDFHSEDLLMEQYNNIQAKTDALRAEFEACLPTI